MKLSSIIFGPILLVVGTLAAGWMHDNMTDRWGPKTSLSTAAQRLTRPLPDRLGNWQLRRENEISDDVTRVLQCPAYVSRVYEHAETGDIVSVALLLGPSGPIAVHTPEVCYSSRDYSIASERKETPIVDGDGNSHTFWEVTVQSKEIDSSSLRVFYGWTRGTGWEAARSPRFAYGGAPYLYKLQLSCDVQRGAAPTDFDPCDDFLSQFLPQIRSRLIDPALPTD